MSTLSPTLLQDLLGLLTAWAGAFLAALWLALAIWTYRDMRARHRDPWAAWLAALTVAVLFLPGVVIYLLLRPRTTLEEEYQKALEEEALLESLEEVQRCPGCTRRVQSDWMVCPTCFTRLKKVCHQCGKLMELAWTLCPYCGTPVPGARKEKATTEDILQSLALDMDASASPPSTEEPEPPLPE